MRWARPAGVVTSTARPPSMLKNLYRNLGRATRPGAVVRTLTFTEVSGSMRRVNGSRLHHGILGEACHHPGYQTVWP
jgi:hypothetical protein